MYTLKINGVPYQVRDGKYFDAEGNEVPDPRPDRPFWIPHIIGWQSAGYVKDLMAEVDSHNAAIHKKNQEDTQSLIRSRVADFMQANNDKSVIG